MREAHRDCCPADASRAESRRRERPSDGVNELGPRGEKNIDRSLVDSTIRVDHILDDYHAWDGTGS